MEMESEVNRILQGQVVETADYANARKIIGVSEDNITIKPGETECALGKQGAFVKKEEVIETFDAVTSGPAEAITETLDFSSAPSPSDLTAQAPATDTLKPAALTESEPQANKFILPEASVSDIAVGDSVKVESLDALQTMMPEKPSEVVTEAIQEEVATEVQLPAMDNKIIAEAPIGIDENLFVNNEPAPAPSVLTPEKSVELPQSTQDQSANTQGALANSVSPDVMKMLEILHAKLKESEEELEKIQTALGNTTTENKTDETGLAQKSEATEISAPAVESVPETEQQDSILAAALDQINQMPVPELDTPTLEGPGPVL